MICKKNSEKILSGVAKVPMKMSHVYYYYNLARDFDEKSNFGIFIDELQKTGVYIIDDEFESEFEKKLRKNYER